MLAPAGYLLLFVPALKFLYSDFDKKIGHFRRYEKSSLEKQISSIGFSIEKSKYFDLLGILPWYVNFVILKNRMNGGDISLYDNLVIPLERFFESSIPPVVGKNILLVARKK